MKFTEFAPRIAIFIILVCTAKADIGKEASDQMNRLQDWKPSLVYDKTDAVIVGERGAYFTTVVYKRGNELSGEGVIRRLKVNDILYGAISGTNEVLFLHPPAGMHEYVGLLDGKAIFFLRKLSVPETENIITLIPQGQKQIAVEQDLWTFATEQTQWMSYISVSEEMPTCQLGIQLQRIAKIEKGNIEEYVKSLGVLRKQATQGNIRSKTKNDLDEFQRAILERFIARDGEGN